MTAARPRRDRGKATASGVGSGAAGGAANRPDAGSYALRLHRDTVLASWAALAEAFGIPLPPERDEHAPTRCGGVT